MSKRCAEVQRELAWLLLEDPAGGTGNGSLASHLKECSRCALEGENLRALLGSLGGQDIPDPGDAYWQTFLPRLRNRIAIEKANAAARRARNSWVWALGASAASFLLAALVVGRWAIPPEVRARAQLHRMATQSDPERLQSALDALLPGTGAIAPGTDRVDSGSLASDMERALEEAFPEDDSDAYSAAGELGPAERQILEKALDPDWV